MTPYLSLLCLITILDRMLTRTGYKIYAGYPTIHAKAYVKINRKITNPLPAVCARRRALVRRGLAKGVLVEQVAVRAASPSEPSQRTTTVHGAWAIRRSGEALLQMRRPYYFLVIGSDENCQVRGKTLLELMKECPARNRSFQSLL